ncbi:MAG: class I SAM-dependent methyltransferase [Chloroflexota bacterium]|nr:class I SAM-dependent methyltransferase [Chloroflexota bacterium]
MADRGDRASKDRDVLLARYYDLEYREYAHDLDFYIQYALALDPRKQLPVLELGCGTGRILVALAQAGFDVVGVDTSQAMLDVAAGHLKAGGVSKRATLVRSDMRDLQGVPDWPFNLAYCALNTFAYLTSTEDQLALLAGVRSRLVQHGVLILDLTPPLPHLLPPSNGEMVHQGSYHDAEQQATSHKLVAGVADDATQTHHVTIFYDREGEDGTLSRLTQRLTMRWTGRYEMELLLKLAGYKVEQIYGGYELEEYGQGSERMIFVART